MMKTVAIILCLVLPLAGCGGCVGGGGAGGGGTGGGGLCRVLSLPI